MKKATKKDAPPPVADPFGPGSTADAHDAVTELIPDDVEARRRLFAGRVPPIDVASNDTRLVEVEVKDTSLKLLRPAAGVEVTLEIRVEMARRLIAVGPKLPRYIIRGASFLAGLRRAEIVVPVPPTDPAPRTESDAARTESTGLEPSHEDGGNTMATKKAKSKKAASKKASAKKPNGITTVAAQAGKKDTGLSAAKAKAGNGFDDGSKISWLIRENPRNAGSGTHARFTKYFGAETVGEYFSKGGTPGDLRWDVKHKYLTVTKS